MKLPENLKFFSWMVMHGSLPTNHLRVAHHLSVDPSCMRCGAASETILHTLRDCSHSTVTWRFLGFDNVQSFAINDPTIWFKTHALMDNGALFVIACWFVWRARNDAVFFNNNWSTWQTLNQIQTLLEVVFKVFGQHVHRKEPRQVQWHSPNDNMVKLNVDGSSIGNLGRSSFGGLLRDAHGQWLGGFSGFCGITNNTKVELLAIDYGLKMAWETGHHRLICESDSKVALSLVEQGVHNTHSYAPIIDHIRSYKDFAWDLIFQHTLCEGNAAVDWLAKYGANMKYGFMTWNTCPHQLSSTLLADAVGTVFTRL